MDGFGARLASLWQGPMTREGWLVMGERQLPETPPKLWLKELVLCISGKMGEGWRGWQGEDRLRDFFVVEII